MLVQFSVGNYLSFKDRQTLSLVASRDKTLEGNTFPASDGSGLSLLKSVGLYGANASGKSNVLKALAFMRDFALGSARDRKSGEEIPVAPFKLDSETVGQPSEFEIVIIVGDHRYAYGFTIDRRRVHEEWLTVAVNGGRPRNLFRRNDDEGIRFGDYWRGAGKRLATMTRPDALFLSVAAQFNSEMVQPVVTWFDDFPATVNSELDVARGTRISTLMLVNLGSDSDVDDFMRVADLGIERVKAVREQTDAAHPPGGASPDRAGLHGVQSEDSEVPKTVHRRPDGDEVVFDLQREESAGTARLFALAGHWMLARWFPRVLVVDELDARLHPLMTRHLIETVYQSPERSQLVFTTHDCSLLDSKLFRRDQIWFTEKDATGATQLYSLWDYLPVRKDENYRLGYLTGRYGAIPFIGELSFGQGE